MPAAAIRAEAAARFAADLTQLWPEDERAGPLGLAVSGGPDSLALLLLAHAALPGEIAVASVDHGLRPEAAGEVALVEQVCAARGIPFAALRVAVAPGNLQDRARAARYAALARWAGEAGLGAVATAHTCDDAAETLLMRLLRGSGIAGLAGVRPVGRIEGSDAVLLRPLLGWRKAELERIVADAGLTPARDPSNADPAFARVALRARMAAAADWLDPVPLAASAVHLAEAWGALGWYAECDFEEMVERLEDGGAPAYAYCANAPRIIGIETICRIVGELGGHVTRSEASRAWDRLWAGENASLGGVLAVPTIERIEKVGARMRVWRFRIEPPRRVQ